jgi:hypothetical protein
MMRLQDAALWNKSRWIQCRSEQSSIFVDLDRTLTGQPVHSRFGLSASHPQTSVILVQPSTGNHCFCSFTGDYRFSTTLA